MLTWLKRLLWGLLVILIILPLVGALYQIIVTEIDLRNYPPPGQMVDVGGYRLHLYCLGENTAGRPTVILETGLGGLATSSSWGWVQPLIAKTARVCAYDRAGLGWSEPSPYPRDAQRIVAELHRLLQKAQIPGPYVLVGWSFGGLYVRAYASQYPEEVAGMVLLDSTSPEQCTSTPAWQAQCASSVNNASIVHILSRFGIMRLNNLFQPATGLPDQQNAAILASSSTVKDWDAQNAEFLASPATYAQVLSSQALGAIPLFVLTATDHGAPPDMEQQWQVWQSGFTALSTNSEQQVVPGATHNSLLYSSTDANVTAEAILKVVEAARTGQQLKP